MSSVEKASEIQLKTTTGGLEYVLNERATKNHHGGTNDNEDETQSVMMVWPGHTRCPVTNLQKYFAKREPWCDALWQKRKNHNTGTFCQDDNIWYYVPMGKHKLENLLKEMCKKAGLGNISIANCI